MFYTRNWAGDFTSCLISHVVHRLAFKAGIYLKARTDHCLGVWARTIKAYAILQLISINEIAWSMEPFAATSEVSSGFRGVAGKMT